MINDDISATVPFGTNCRGGAAHERDVGPGTLR
jgi:hypothetical protein